MTTRLEVARRAAARAADVIRDHYSRYRRDRAELVVERKEDDTPVTAADRAAEAVIEEEVRRAFPDDGFFGEEGGRKNAGAAWQWLVDPIDGTKAFLRGLVGSVSTQIALHHDGRFELGVSSAPLVDELAVAERGRGATIDGEAASVSSVATVARAAISITNVRSLASDARWQAVGRLVVEAELIRGFGDFQQYHALARGSIDAVIESDVSILDVAALSVLVEEAGGVVTDLEGRALTLDSTSVLATNGRLHEELLTRLAH